MMFSKSVSYRLRAAGAVVFLCAAAFSATASPAKAQPQAQPIAAVPAPLSAAELNVAGAVHVGSLACELGQSVRLDPDPVAPGYFRLQLQKVIYRMRPVESRTGAVRLEDEAQGAVWIQLANKSMLMSQKLGRRLADECASAIQRNVAQAMKLNPLPSLLDPQ
jgi:hypothetical protein